jgi:hypothetical protein
MSDFLLFKRNLRDGSEKLKRWFREKVKRKFKIRASSKKFSYLGVLRDAIS